MKISRNKFLKTCIAGIAGIKTIASGNVEAVEKEQLEILEPPNLCEYKPCKNCGERLPENLCSCCTLKIRMDNWQGRSLTIPCMSPFDPANGLYGGISDSVTLEKNRPFKCYKEGLKETFLWDGKGTLTSWRCGNAMENYKGFLLDK